MPSKKFNKICTICGEKAIGFNFCAISCESCKAFFRRNASKFEEYKCPFNDNCKIDQLTRKFCRKCRLKKCFAVGMKQEWILTDEEKEMRRIKIEANKKGKHEYNRNGTSCQPDVTFQMETSGSDTNYSHFNESCETISVDNNISDEEIITNIMRIEEYVSEIPTTVLEVTGTSDNTNHCWSFSPLVNTEEQTVVPFDSQTASAYNMDNSDEISDSTYEKAVELELSVIPIPKSVRGSNQLNEVEYNRIIEIFNASLSFRRPYPVNQIVFGKAEDLSKFFIERFEDFSRKFVTASKSLKSFNELCQNDQIALIKSATLETMFMRTAQYFDYINEQWTFYWGDGSSITFKLDVLQGIPMYKGDKSAYQLFRNYNRKMCSNWDNDPFILHLMFPILLFNPERPNLLHKEPIKLQQQLHMYLLQRYLQSKYNNNNCEYKVKFLRILDVITDLQQLNQIQRKYYKYTDPCILGPLSREILDLTANSEAERCEVYRP